MPQGVDYLVIEQEGKKAVRLQSSLANLQVCRRQKKVALFWDFLLSSSLWLPKLNLLGSGLSLLPAPCPWRTASTEADQADRCTWHHVEVAGRCLVFTPCLAGGILGITEHRGGRGSGVPPRSSFFAVFLGGRNLEGARAGQRGPFWAVGRRRLRVGEGRNTNKDD